MKKFPIPFEQARMLRHLLYWTALVVPVALVVGSLVALFLWLLDAVTQTRWAHPQLLFALPLAGVLLTYLYLAYGKNSDAGNNLILDEIHQPGGGIPARMTPLVLFSTLVTHLFGGSAGREGTAVQMGGSMAALFARTFRLRPEEKRMLLLCGMAAGFGAVFGTPVTGALFALEVVAIGRIRYDALLPCFLASFAADIVCSAWGIHHTRYALLFSGSSHAPFPWLHTDLLLLAKVLVASALFGLAGFAFAELSHGMKAAANRYIPRRWMIPVLGAALVIGISYALGTFAYLGLGVTNPDGAVSIVSSFAPGGAQTWSWLWKLLLTAITLSAGFRGGEVTPLFFIGAALGNTLASISGAPVDLFAGLGFIAVFAAATNTPIACTLMGVELFGSDNLVYYAVACFTAYYFSGHTGIYSAQRVAMSKFHAAESGRQPLRERRSEGGEGAGNSN